MNGREDARRREAGRRRREVTMARAVGNLIGIQRNEKCRDRSYKIMLCACKRYYEVFAAPPANVESKSPALVFLRWDFGAERERSTI